MIKSYAFNMKVAKQKVIGSKERKIIENVWTEI